MFPEWVTEEEAEAERQKFLAMSDEELDAWAENQFEMMAEHFKRAYGIDLETLLETE